MDTCASIVRAAEGGVRFALMLGGNLFGSNPDSRFAAKALSQIDTTVSLSTTLNTGHVFGRGRETIVLPVLARDEEPQPTTQESMFNYVRLSDGAAGGPPRHEGPRAESEVIASIAERVLGATSPIDWGRVRSHDEIRRAIAAIVPGFERLADIGRTKEEFTIAGRILHEPAFPTPSGRAKFHIVPLPHHPANGDGRVRLMTIRSEGQFNTVVYEEEDVYRGQDRRDVIMMSREDVGRLGLRVNQRVSVRSETGAMEVVVREIDIRPGNAAMYYPEANILVPRRIDPESKTPAFKHVLVTIEP
jgi:anaerobic selenocysteine-containing dehydrogenase